MVNSIKTHSKMPKKSAKSPFVSFEKLVEVINALKKATQLFQETENEKSVTKKQLFDDISDEIVWLEVVLKKIPINRSTFIHSIDLPHHWRHESDSSDTCLIVRDVNKEPLTDRDLDLDMSKSFYKNLLEEKNASDLMSEILPMRELLNEYKLYEAKQKLSNAFDVFFVDRKLMRNRFDHITKFLGKTFWFDAKKVPIPIDLSRDDIRSQIETALNQTRVYLSGKGTNTTISIGILKQSTKDIAENLLAINKKLKILFGNNMRALRLKTSKSMSITFYLDCSSMNEVELPLRKSKIEPIIDEFTNLTNARVKVLPSGDVRVLPGDGESDEVDDREKKLIRHINKRKKLRRV